MALSGDSSSSLESSNKVGAPWYGREWFVRSITYGFLLLVLIKFVHSVFFKQNDFDLHLHWGDTAFRGTFYGDAAAWQSAFFQYPPGRILFDEFLAVLPHSLARALIFILAVGSLFITRRIWWALAAQVKPAQATIDFAASAGALVLLATWVVRDLDECGLQILLLFMLSMCAWSLYRGAGVQAAAWIGIAITYKVTPVIVLPLLLLKRRFVEAFCAIGFVIAFNFLVPALFWGPQHAWDAVLRHVELIQEQMALEDPSQNPIATTLGNRSLGLAITRYLRTYPPGSEFFIDRGFDDHGCIERGIALSECHQHPLFYQFLNLPASTVKRIMQLTLVCIGAALAWAMRHRWLLAQTRRDTARYGLIAPEWAVTCVFVAILAPFVWQQHLVLVMPCAYLVLRDLLMREDKVRWRWATIGFVFVVAWILHRNVLSKQLELIAISYHLDILALFSLVVATLTIDGAKASGAAKRQVAS
jgi:alpha-1,2-mannosyltransferase